MEPGAARVFSFARAGVLTSTDAMPAPHKHSWRREIRLCTIARPLSAPGAFPALSSTARSRRAGRDRMFGAAPDKALGRCGVVIGAKAAANAMCDARRNALLTPGILTEMWPLLLMKGHRLQLATLTKAGDKA